MVNSLFLGLPLADWSAPYSCWAEAAPLSVAGRTKIVPVISRALPSLAKPQLQQMPSLRNQ